jgi:hypothetical protein
MIGSQVINCSCNVVFLLFAINSTVQFVIKDLVIMPHIY